MAAHRRNWEGTGRPERMRLSNDRIAESAQRYHFMSRVPMLCECSDIGCQKLFLISLPDYRRLRSERAYVTVPGHTVSGSKAEPPTAEYAVHRLNLASSA
jgi:hypothetical protein